MIGNSAGQGDVLVSRSPIQLTQPHCSDRSARRLVAGRHAGSRGVAEDRKMSATSPAGRGRRVLTETRRRLRGRDLALGSAGATLYGALAVVPSLLAAVALAAVLLGRDGVQQYG